MNQKAFEKRLEEAGISTVKTAVPGYTYASTHTENMWLAYQWGAQDAQEGAKGAKVPKGAAVE